jgi:hypothetical protein
MKIFSRNNRKSQIPNNSNKIAYISYKKINFKKELLKIVEQAAQIKI